MLKHLQTRLYSAVRNLIREELGLREEEESKNIQLELQRRALQTTADYVERRMANVDSVLTRFKLLDLALSRSVPNGLYCEFGVLFRCVHQLYRPAHGTSCVWLSPRRRFRGPDQGDRRNPESLGGPGRICDSRG